MSADEWSRLTADCEDPKLAPRGPVRLIVQKNDGLVVVKEARVTSYSDNAQPYSDGELTRLDLTSEEARWLIDTLTKATGGETGRETLKTAHDKVAALPGGFDKDLISRRTVLLMLKT